MRYLLIVLLTLIAIPAHAKKQTAREYYQQRAQFQAYVDAYKARKPLPYIHLRTPKPQKRVRRGK